MMIKQGKEGRKGRATEIPGGGGGREGDRKAPWGGGGGG